MIAYNAVKQGLNQSSGVGIKIQAASSLQMDRERERERVRGGLLVVGIASRGRERNVRLG